MFAEPIDPRATTWMRSKASCSASGARAIPSARTSSISGTRVTRRMLYTLDTGHYHPTETITDKISAVLAFLPEILLHVSRGVRWDSDHVVVLGDDLDAIAQELVRGGFLPRTHIGLDYFDASINRVAAWVIGTRNMLKALLKALVEPIASPARVRGRRRLHRPPRAAGRNQGAALGRCLGPLLRYRWCRRWIAMARRCQRVPSAACWRRGPEQPERDRHVVPIQPARTPGGRIGRRPVGWRPSRLSPSVSSVLTFDDGPASHATFVAPLLKNTGLAPRSSCVSSPEFR